jgi:hypothetical protein
VFFSLCSLRLSAMLLRSMLLLPAGVLPNVTLRSALGYVNLPLRGDATQ